MTPALVAGRPGAAPVAADRVEVHVDGRPRDIVEATDRHRSSTVEGVPGARVVRVEGLGPDGLVAARTLHT
jgi:hypothetical protein